MAEHKQPGSAKAYGISDQAVAKKLGDILAARAAAAESTLTGAGRQNSTNPPPRRTEKELMSIVQRVNQVEQGGKPRTEDDDFWIGMVTAARDNVAAEIKGVSVPKRT